MDLGSQSGTYVPNLSTNRFRKYILADTNDLDILGISQFSEKAW